MAFEVFKGNIEHADPQDPDEDMELKEAGICCLNCALIARFDNNEKDMWEVSRFVSEHETKGHEVYAGIFDGNDFIPKVIIRGLRQ